MAYNLYPLASEKGTYIPLEVYGPVAATAHAITTTPMASVITIAELPDQLIEVISDADCLISFGPIPVSYTAGAANSLGYLLPAGVPRILKVSSTTLSAVLTAGTTGTLFVNQLVRWDKLVTEVQQFYG